MTTRGTPASGGSGADDKRNMLTCQELVELVTAYREGLLPPEERRRFDEHLAVCPPCGSYVEQFDLTIRTLGTLDASVEEAPATQELLRIFQEWKAQRQF